MNNFESRINLDCSLKELSLKVCLEYNLGSFKDNKLIEIGYEDFNYILTTEKGKFVIKIFSKERSDIMAQQLVDRVSVAQQNKISTPKIYTTINGENLLTTKLRNTKFRILVMEYINGKDFYSLDELPSDKELVIIAKELARLNSIEYKPNFVYDKWAIINFDKEYEQNIKYVDNKYLPLLKFALEQFKSCDLTKLKHGFVHGDIIETNVLKDKEDKLYFIDFSVSNYLPVIIDLAVTICDLCLNLNDLQLSKERAKIFVEAYEKILPLSSYEKQCLKKFIICHQANTILQTIREKVVENNNSYENERFYQKGVEGLQVVIKED